MVQQDETIQQALSYVRYQGAKPLADLRALMERTAADCARCLEGVSEPQAAFKPSPEEWSIKEVLAHLATSMEGVNREIASRAQGQAASRQAQMGLVADADQPFQALRQRLSDLWAQTVALVGVLPESGTNDRTFEHPVFGPLNTKEWVAFQRIHAMDHVQQIEKVKAAPAYPSA